MTDAQVVYEYQDDYAKRVGVRFGDRVIWLGITGSKAYEQAEQLAKEIVRRWHAKARGRNPMNRRKVLSEAVRLLRCVRVLDCGAHSCRYCPAKSPEWNHDPHCPYIESQREYVEAQAVARMLEDALKEESK